MDTKIINKQNNVDITGLNTRKSDGERFAQIAEMGESVFHSGDLANLWGIYNTNTLHTTLSRYQKRGLIFRIQNGLYSIKNIAKINPYLLGIKVLHGPVYVSCESVLYENGILNQLPQQITLVSSISKNFSVGINQYHSRQMRDEYLFNDSGIEMVLGVRKATVSRAVADMLYFNPGKYFDAGNSKLINWRKVKKISKLVGYNAKILKMGSFDFDK